MFSCSPGCLLGEFDILSQVWIKNKTFAHQFKAFFYPDRYLYLDIVCPYHQYIATESKNFGNMFYECRKNPKEVLVAFLNILVRVYVNSVRLIYKRLKKYPKIEKRQRIFIMSQGIRFVYKLMLSFCLCADVLTFRKIYVNFVPEKDYDVISFKILNEHYLKYLYEKEIFYSKNIDKKVVPYLVD